ncbi:RING finger protein 212B isoform X2 [Clupea harengus]|uniref:RING finger protein 212B isoform X2 n=1 Tax=Clupea harengus TaxID=7950 RepID=A0A6P8EUS5_CLUHA|nr:RING finger protein 212B isoform X2 [Clupea harengus]
MMSQLSPRQCVKLQRATNVFCTTRMDWFHCNRCFHREGKKFAVSTCGHICCDNCINPKQCSVCGTSCNYLPISNQMKPQEQVYFRDPVKLIQSRMEHISQIAQFQLKQMDRVMTYNKKRSLELERRLKEVTEECYRLKKENTELKKPLSQWRVSPGKFQSNGTPQRMSLPIAVTPPVTAYQQSGSRQGAEDTLERFRERHSRYSMNTPPGSVSSVSSLGSLHDRGQRTPNSISMHTPTRSDLVTPIFRFQFQPGSAHPSPRP